MSIQPQLLVQTIGTMSSDEGGGYLSVASSASTAITAPHDAHYVLQYRNICDEGKLRQAEEIVFARHGALGLRVFRLLTEKSALEDRHIADETLASLADTRQVLTGLVRDNFLRLVELPKIVSADRQPKNSIWLYALDKTQALNNARSQILKAYQTVLKKHELECAAFRSKMPPQYFMDPGATLLAEEQEQCVTQFEATEQALNKALISLVRSIFLFEFC